MVLLVGGCGGSPGAATVDRPGGAGGKGDDPNELSPGAAACEPASLRAPTPEVLVAPEGYEEAILARLATAEQTLDVQMYQLERPSYVDALLAAHERGVHVRVLLHGAEEVNAVASQRLIAAGVDAREPPAGFPHYHPKVALLDGTTAIVMSGNWNESGVTERNYAVVLQDLDDVADLAAIFEADFDGAPLDLTCTRLLVTPLNARERLLAHLRSATRRLDLSIMYMTDRAARDVVLERAAAGVPVRVLLADPTWITSNTATAERLAEAGIPVEHYLVSRLHAKLMLADDVAFIGSENLSRTSLDQNREIGVLLSEPAILERLDAQFEADWAAGVAAAP
jgi:phosphatidylserine/phosphatidylglycerophosphate/cardiolipin synthase-like enzyme